jgi:RNA-directed DNA polymerase
MNNMLNIRSVKHLALRLGISKELLLLVYDHIDTFCTMEEKETKNGKKRKIAYASKKLKRIQRAILDNLLSTIPVHTAAHGATKGHSSKTNAAIHSGNKFVLCFDLKSCFPNIHSSRVRKMFEEQLGCSPDVSTILTRLTTFKYHLAQGFPTSPAILNIICAALDEQIMRFVSIKNLAYTRYIDDITVSGNFISGYTRKRIREVRYPRQSRGLERQ